MAIITMGIVLVACLAACSTASVPEARSTSTCSATRVRCEGRVPLGLTFAGAELDEEVLPLHVAEVPQAVLKGLDEGRRAGLGSDQHADPHDVAWWLRLAGKRRTEEAKSDEDGTPNRATLHSGLLLCQICVTVKHVIAVA